MVPCNVDALHAASVGVGALGSFSVDLAGFLEGRVLFSVDSGAVLFYRWGSAQRERIAFIARASIVGAAVIAASTTALPAPLVLPVPTFALVVALRPVLASPHGSVGVAACSAAFVASDVATALSLGGFGATLLA